MKLNEISADAVTKALSQRRTMGEQAFYAKYDQRDAKKYVILDEGDRLYSALAILRVAYRIQNPTLPPLTRDELSSGDRAVAVFKELGFKAGKHHEFVHRDSA